MKKLTLLFVLLAACVYAAPPAPYPFTVDSQAQTVPALQVYQAAARTFRVTFKDGTNASSLAGATPWMWWATGVTARSYYTSTCTVVSSPSGVADFLFDSVALNWSGGVSGVYGVGVTDSNGYFAVSRQGTFVISASPFGAGVAMPQATSNINCDLYTWLNPPWQNYTNSGYTMAQADAKFATGTPLYIETDAAGIAWAGTGITAAAVAQLWAGSNHTALGVETAARIGADTSLSNIANAATANLILASNSLQSQITSIVGSTGGVAALAYTNRAAEALNSNVWASARSIDTGAVATEVAARIAADTNKVAKTGDTMTGQLTITTNLSINAAGTQWYIGSAPDQFWISTGLFGDDTYSWTCDNTNGDLRIGGAFVGSAAKLTSFPATLATATALSAETNARIAADALKLTSSHWASAESTTGFASRTAYVAATGALWTAHAAETNARIAADATKLNLSGGAMTGVLTVSTNDTPLIFPARIGTSTLDSGKIRFTTRYNGTEFTHELYADYNSNLVFNSARVFLGYNALLLTNLPMTGVSGLWTALSNVPIDNVSGLSTALESKVSSVAILPTLTVADLSSVGTNLCTGFTTQTGTLGGVKITNIYANIAAGKTYAWGLGLQSTYLGTSWLTCANFSLTNSTPGSRTSNYFSMATSTDRVVLTISSVAGMAQIVTNVFVCEVRTGTVWIAGDARVGGDIIAANYGHNIPLMTNVEDVAIGKSAAASGLGVAVGGYANGQAFGTAVGKSSEGYNYGSSVGYMANGINYGAALGFFANAESCGVALGRFANGAKSNIAIGASAKSVGSLSISIGHEVTNSTDNSAALRGSLYLDGGTGIYYRSTFGSGAWTLFSSGASAGITNVVQTNAAAGVATINGSTLSIGTNIPPAGSETDPIWAAASTGYATVATAAGLSNAVASKLSPTNRWTPATAVCSTGTVQFSPGADNLYTYLPTNPFTVQMAYGVTEVGTVRFEVQASTCTITWGASIKNSGRDSSTNLTMSTTTNMSFLLDKRYGESKSSIYQIGL